MTTEEKFPSLDPSHLRVFSNQDIKELEEAKEERATTNEDIRALRKTHQADKLQVLPLTQSWAVKSSAFAQSISRPRFKQELIEQICAAFNIFSSLSLGYYKTCAIICIDT